MGTCVGEFIWSIFFIITLRQEIYFLVVLVKPKKTFVYMLIPD